MTALAQYARLEAPARYFDGTSARALPVVVSFGERSLVIMGYDGVAIAHWPLASLRAVSGRGDTVAQIAPDADAEERLVVEDAEMVQAIEKVCPDLHRRTAERRGMGRAVVYGIGALCAVLALVFVILPGLAGQLALLIPPERERQLGDAVIGQIRSVLDFAGDAEIGFCAEERGLAALGEMSARLEGTVDLPYPLHVSVLDHPMVNAFAVPGGRVVLFRGLIEQARSPEEVAGVLAHEIAHVVHRDPTVGLLRSAGTAGILGLLVGDVFGAAVVVAGTEAVMNAQYQQDVERRADDTAVAMLRDAGLPSEPFAGFFRRLAERYGGSMGMFDYLASHPALDDRAERAAAGDALKGAPYRPALDDATWLALRQVCSATADRPPA